ncbi:MAG: hypothetical protein A2015_08945 [Spirochaetes bacterium GWF1_31_7]|nr:MAG: hypothetical protein A2Y30_06715 [Spirochaetes bacterium GWE1_32_154]OHD48047.1 MAG: hypothetical protein A2015_08945 [Spirochaetes bacterium GWF1_31_7]OHD49636.1 MAG: hypothetical protein A2Y29_06690 [Spirochaetes bacterium GWE2_31_10]OHD81730.1 MAG: hypothetical protein A2355_07485 [Spirochaetes bacterium RIFOXYB1_FULL_32_8]HBD96188.1 hypothetical protein [Spirochaetia bacterium]
MKGLLCYYSGTGNTKLAVQYIAKKTKNCEWSFHDFMKDGTPDTVGYDIIGIAAWTDFFGPPLFLKNCLKKMKGHKKHAFVFNTYGNMSGRTLPVLKSCVRKQGFKVIGGHSLNTPENFPPLINNGLKNDTAPSTVELKKFDTFINELDEWFFNSSSKVSFPFDGYLMPVFPRTMAKMFIKKKVADPGICTQCGLCKTLCPYDAISLAPFPVFNEKKCNGCWVCYNRCPVSAISVGSLRTEGKYEKPHENLIKKLI